MQTAATGAAKSQQALFAGDTPIELSNIITYDVHTMPYGYLSRICGNGFEALLHHGRRLANNIGDNPALLQEARRKALAGQLCYVCIYTADGMHFTFFNVGQKTEWDSLLQKLHDSCPLMTA